MPIQKGIEYTTSNRKIALDRVFNAAVHPVAGKIEHLVIAAIGARRRGEEPYFEDKRVGNDGALFLYPKIRTMRSLAPGEVPVPVEAGKLDPRIFPGARLVRGTGLDELPQLGLVPKRLSFVGPRSCYPEYLDYFLDSGSKVDSGPAEAYRELYFNPDIRHGITGPAQLKWAWTDERSPELIAECMRADLDYYLEDASAARDVAIVAATPVSLVGSSLAKMVHRLDSSEVIA